MEEKKFLNAIYENNTISYRGYYKILKVARTIADLDGCENIELNHIMEAISYRTLDKKYLNN